jgi:hypothetical protein
MVTFALVLLVASLIFFILAAFNISLSPRFNALGMGAALAMLAFLIERIKF